MPEPPDLLGRRDHAERLAGERHLDAGHALELAQLLGLEQGVVVGSRGRPLDPHEGLRDEGASHPHPQQAGPLQPEVAGRDLRPQLTHEDLDQLQRSIRVLPLQGCRLLHERLAPGQELLPRPARPGAQTRHHLRRRGLVGRVHEGSGVAVEEPVEEPLALGRPAAAAGDEVDRAQEAHEVDHGGAVGGVVEVVEAVRGRGERVLLEVRVAVKDGGGQRGEVLPEGLADSGRPVPVQEAEVREGVVPKPLPEGRGSGGQAAGVGSKRRGRLRAGDARRREQERQGERSPPKTERPPGSRATHGHRVEATPEG